MNNNWQSYSKEKQVGGFKKKTTPSLFDGLDMYEEPKNPLEEFKLKTPMELKGTIEKKYFFTEDSGFGIYLLETDIGMVKIKGVFVDDLSEGASYVVNGFVTEYNKEKQLQILTYKPITPYSKKGVTSYLSTLKGLKEVRANSIYAMFGNESIEILLTDPFRISTNISGIGKKSVVDWQQQLKDQQETEALTIELLGYGLKVKEIRKLFKKYGNILVDKIKENPYFLSMEVSGYGFKRCDVLAMNMHYKFNGLERIKSGILYSIEDACNSNGHVFLNTDELLISLDNILSLKLTESQINELLNTQKDTTTVNVKLYNSFYNIEKKELYGKKEFVLDQIDVDLIKEALSDLVENKKIIIEDGRVYLSRLYFFELGVTKESARLHSDDVYSSVPKEKFEKHLNSYLKKNKIKLEQKQYESVVSIAYGEGGMHMLNGSAGCGKTFVTKIVRYMIEWFYKEIKKKVTFGLFAPTGKAAKIASKAMGHPFSTVHKGLSYKPGIGFEYNRSNPLTFNVLIVDEFTMVDLELLYNFLQAVKAGSKVIYIGDYKQLPSVSPGNCFLDILDSEFINVITLDVVKRQGLDSGLLKNANRIIAGQMIQSEKEIGDSFFIEANDNSRILALTLKSIERLLSKGYSFDDVQVLVPMRKTMIGANYLNLILQEHFNPKKGNEIEFLSNEFLIDEKIYKLNFRKGDKVIHIKNNSELQWHDENYQPIDEMFGINNGECGRIVEAVREKEDGSWVNKLYVQYEDGVIIYYDEDFNQLEHAYALTIHKSQGSQWKAVLLPFSNSFYPMFQNNLIYTAWTRAMEFAAVIGQERAVMQAINTFTVSKRNSYLKERLIELKEAA